LFLKRKLIPEITVASLVDISTFRQIVIKRFTLTEISNRAAHKMAEAAGQVYLYGTYFNAVIDRI